MYYYLDSDYVTDVDVGTSNNDHKIRTIVGKSLRSARNDRTRWVLVICLFWGCCCTDGRNDCFYTPLFSDRRLEVGQIWMTTIDIYRALASRFPQADSRHQSCVVSLSRFKAL